LLKEKEERVSLKAELNYRERANDRDARELAREIEYGWHNAEQERQEKCDARPVSACRNLEDQECDYGKGTDQNEVCESGRR